MTKQKKHQGEIIVVSEELKAKSNAGKTLTPYEKCVTAHSGQCGVCNSDGSFIACA